MRCFLFLMAILAAGNCQDSKGIVKDLLRIIGHDTFQIIGPCFLNVEFEKLGLKLYTQRHPNGIPLNEQTWDEFDTTLPTRIATHGFLECGWAKWLLELKNAYLGAGYNYNVILLDWSHYAVINYAKAVCFVPKVGQALGEFLFKFHQQKGLRLEDVKVIGHSLGSHVMGHCGKRVKQLTGGRRLGYIVGLDPAGPGFVNILGQAFSPDKRLASDDADFVQAIHSNAGLFGIKDAIGTVDFYVHECGLDQPGCPAPFDLKKVTNAIFGQGQPLMINNCTINGEFSPLISCSHVKSHDYFTESVNSKNFLGRECNYCYEWKAGKCNDHETTIMGEHCPTSARGTKYLDVNRDPPYAKTTLPTVYEHAANTLWSFLRPIKL